jgi:hypothetical protein
MQTSYYLGCVMLEEGNKAASPSLGCGPPELNRQERDAQNTIYYETEEENIKSRSSRNGSTPLHGKSKLQTSLKVAKN